MRRQFLALLLAVASSSCLGNGTLRQSGLQDCNGVKTDGGQCIPPNCQPTCQGRVCGDDGCGGVCGNCAAGTACNTQGMCVCAPNCSGKMCGPDGCGGTCGTCASGLVCNTRSGVCATTCTPDCTGRVCGDDGCGTGTCPPNSCPTGTQCDPAGSGICVCAPQCAGKQCGSDGCGGVCGSCSTIQTCSNDQCIWPMKTWGTDVYPIFSNASCAQRACHSGTRPAENLDLSTATIGYQQLVGVASVECPGKTRVIRNDYLNSYLIAKLTGVGMCTGSVMPKAGSELPGPQVDTVRAWIATGANP